MRRALPSALLLALALAGCLTPLGATVDTAQTGYDPLDDLVHDLGQVLEAAIPVAGGVDLHGTVYVPDVDAGMKVPVLLDLGPYYGNLNPETSAFAEDQPPNRLYHHFLQRGYAIALVSLRGTGQSGGCFTIGSAEERQDAAAAVEWLAQQPWSDGTVAMTGVSYDGTTPWEAYVEAPPSLKAIVPVAGISDHYRYSFYEGVPVGGGAAFHTYYAALVDYSYGVDLGPAFGRARPPRIPAPLDMASWASVQPTNVCLEQLDVLTQPYMTYRDGVHGPFWDERDMSAMLGKGNAAVFVVHGLKDFNVKADHVQHLWDALPEPKRMLLGQWEHNIPWSNSYDHEQNWTQYNATIDQFLDAHVRGDPAALAAEAAAPPVLVQDSANRTWGLTRWPPAESTPVAYGLGGDGVLATGAAKEGEARLATTPLSTVQNLAGEEIPVVAPQELVFETEAFAADALFLGNPWLTLEVSVDRPEGMLEARLYEVDGKEWELVSMGWQNLATRTSRDRGEPVPTGTPMAVTIQMLAIAQNVEAGHKLALVLMPDNRESLTPQSHMTTFTIALGGEGGAALWLPAFDATAAEANP